MIRERLISALIGTLFIAVFQPFGLSHFGLKRWALLAGLLVIVAASCLLSELAVRHLFRLPYREGSEPAYSQRRGWLFDLCNVSLMPLLMTLFLDRFACSAEVDNHLSWHTYFWSLTVCLCASFIIGLFWRNVYWKRYYARQLAEAQLINGMLLERARCASSVVEEAVEEEPVLLEGSTKERLSLRVPDFLFAESEGNYVSVHYLEGGECRQVLLRTSIRQVVAALCTHADVMQCHRAFVVNLRHVERVEGRSSGIGLLLKHCDTVVPVSKGYAGAVKEAIKHPSRS